MGNHSKESQKRKRSRQRKKKDVNLESGGAVLMAALRGQHSYK